MHHAHASTRRAEPRTLGLALGALELEHLGQRRISYYVIA